MFFSRNEHKRANPYLVLTVGALAMIGAFNVVRCTKNSIQCVKNKIRFAFTNKDVYGSTVGE